MAISESLFKNATDTAFGIFNNLLDDIVITKKAAKAYNSSTKKYDSGRDTTITTKGSLQNKRIRSDTGVDYIQQELVVQYTKELDTVDVKDIFRINGVVHNVTEISKNKFIITFIIG